MLCQLETKTQLELSERTARGINLGSFLSLVLIDNVNEAAPKAHFTVIDNGALPRGDCPLGLREVEREGVIRNGVHRTLSICLTIACFYGEVAACSRGLTGNPAGHNSCQVVT